MMLPRSSHHHAASGRQKIAAAAIAIDAIAMMRARDIGRARSIDVIPHE
jgi:hypothetical protein